MSRRAARFWSAALVPALVLGAAACGPERPSPRPSSMVVFVPCGDVEAPPEATEEPRHQFCAQIEFVQADRTTRTLQLLLVSDQVASPLENRRLLVYHPGGPGISAVRLTGQDPPDVDLSRFAVLTWDGATASTIPGTCGQASIAFGTDRDRDELAERAAEVTAECTIGFGGLTDVGAVAAAAELEAIRRALEVETIDLLMVSYGAAIGETYLASYGPLVGRAVLDAPVALEVPWSERVPAVGQALADGASALAGACATPRCSQLAATGQPPTMGVIKHAILAGDPTVGGGQAELTATMFDQAVLLALRSEAYWEAWSNAIDEALGGDGTDLWALGEKEYFDLDRGVFYRSLCADINRPQDYAAYGAPDDDLLFAWTSALAPCAGFPGRARPALVGGDAAVLIVASGRDVLAPASLLDAAPELRALGAVCITDIAGHTSYRDPAVEDLVHAFLEDGRLPDPAECAST